MFASIGALILLAISPMVFAASWIVPGAVWYDTAGNKIDAHGGGIVRRENTFYWTGHSASGETPKMYSSTDLLNWEYLGAQDSSVTGMWRPKFAKPNGEFWLYGQQDREVLSLVSTELVGGYKESAKVLLPPSSYSYSDTGMFQDPSTSIWYILTSADHNNIQINQINSDGSVGARVQAFEKGAYEAPGLFKADGIYFLIVSAKTGWRANPNKVWWATSLSGSWSGGTDIAPEAENTYGSQNTFELTISGSQQTTYMYMGDAWDSTGGASSNYVWLPMDVNTNAKTVTLVYHSMWKVDISTGVVSVPTTKKRYEAEHAVISGRAAITPCSNCKSRRSVHQVDINSDVTFHNVTGMGCREWVTFHYTVSNPQEGEAHILVNNDPVPINISEFNSRAGYHKSIPVELFLHPGDVNTIRFGVSGSADFKATIDAIELHND